MFDAWCFDQSGEPITVEAWGALHDVDGYVFVRKTTIGDVEVSTVWLGIDHQHGDGPPLIFETMIFGGDHHGETWRYPTHDDAVAGHEAVTAALFAECN